jgi:hypothetical protein
MTNRCCAKIDITRKIKKPFKNQWLLTFVPNQMAAAVPSEVSFGA